MSDILCLYYMKKLPLGQYLLAKRPTLSRSLFIFCDTMIESLTTKNNEVPSAKSFTLNFWLSDKSLMYANLVLYNNLLLWDGLVVTLNTWCSYIYTSCGEASAYLYGEFLKVVQWLSSVSNVLCILIVFQYLFSAFTTSSALVIRRTSFLWSSPLSCSVALLLLWDGLLVILHTLFSYIYHLYHLWWSQCTSFWRFS